MGLTIAVFADIIPCSPGTGDSAGWAENSIFAPLSSSGLGYQVLILETGVRLPVGVLCKSAAAWLLKSHAAVVFCPGYSRERCEPGGTGGNKPVGIFPRLHKKSTK